MDSKLTVVQQGSQAVHTAGDKIFVFNPWVRYVFFNIFELPILQLYIYGPSFFGYGFWQGQEPEVICTTLTNVPVSHWNDNPNECGALIYRRFESYMVLIYVVTYIFTLCSLYGCVVFNVVHCVYCKRFRTQNKQQNCKIKNET